MHLLLVRHSVAGQVKQQATQTGAKPALLSVSSCQLLSLCSIHLGGCTVDWRFPRALLLCRENILEAVRRFKDVYGKK
jgi:hypothetical protein